MVGMLHRKFKNGGSGTSSSVKNGVAGSDIGHSGTDFVGMGGGGALLLFYILRHGWTSGWRSGWPRASMITVKCNLVTA